MINADEDTGLFPCCMAENNRGEFVFSLTLILELPCLNWRKSYSMAHLLKYMSVGCLQCPPDAPKSRRAAENDLLENTFNQVNLSIEWLLY